MQKTTETDLYVDWQGYHRMIERLALQVYESKWDFDVVLCLARGGLVAGNVLCRIFDKPLAVLSTSSYRESVGMKQGALDISKNITMTQGELAGRVLLVDDLIDTGVTLAEVKEHLSTHYPAITGVRSAVLWRKGWAKQEPDYCVDLLDNSPWIHQPFEAYDALQPHMLSAWLKKDAAQSEQ
ncbi:phosphoribosyltransferase [Ephemeroptericola cinctiostellae]|nr:phosphoribosyltransferase family protein [Ephemeroptericola cinctiostellae]